MNPEYRQFGDVSSPALDSPPVTSDIGTPRPTQSFRSSVSLIPTPGTVSRRHPTYEPVPLRFWVVALGCGLLTFLGVALEVALRISNKNDGFFVPQKNVFSFVSTGFLTSFFPSLIFGPLAMMVHSFDWAIRMWNPYLILSRGNASADETLLVDYIADSRIFITINALKFKHRFVLVSGITTLATLLFQPLAGAIFSVRQLPNSAASTVQSIRTFGLTPNVNNLNAFAAAAGYAEASVYNNLGAPPFTCFAPGLGWATAEFVFPTDAYLNGSMTVNTTGIVTTANCAVPNQFSVNSSIATNWTVTTTSVEGCTVHASFDPNNSDQQYGVLNVPNCGSNSTDPTFQPVVFWFWRQEPNSGAAVFCEPRIQLHDLTAFASLNNGTLTNIVPIDDYPAANNISGPPLNGIPYNGVIFNSSTDINVQARATSIRSGIPNAIFRLAQQSPGGLDFAFQNPIAFVNYTAQVYTQHLSLATTSNYFLPSNNTVPSVLTQLVPRLYVEPLATHTLSSICLLSSAIIFTLHFLHLRERRPIYLAHPPGSIGSAVALTSHSGFGELLLPYDDYTTFSRALAPLRFSLDRRTGAIVVDDSAVAYVGEMSRQSTRDETMMTLMGKGRGTSEMTALEATLRATCNSRAHTEYPCAYRNAGVMTWFFVMMYYYIPLRTFCLYTFALL
ncbi:hypothetical protein EI94DRAFT_1616713 [Lactarius quietus]|nr:hypothetical protein EI94DRAFT_1616713 [Lactarius quietus]